MRRWLSVLFSLFLWHQVASPQDNVSCVQLLEDAKEAYAAGMLELVPELMLPCLESDEFSGTPKLEAYKLVINAYLFDYLPDEADSLMNDLVDEFPDYRAGASDSEEFTILLNTHLAARMAEPEKVTGGETIRETPGKTPPKPEKKKQQRPPFHYTNSLGFELGMHGTFPQIVERYSLGDPAMDEGTFGILPDIQVGPTMNLMLGRTSEASFSLLYNRTRFSYSALPFSFMSYEYKEVQTRLQLPIAIILKLNPDAERNSVYLRLGIVADYLFSASGSGIRSYESSFSDVAVDKTDITDARRRMNILGMAGVGLRIPFNNAFLFMETRFTSGLLLSNIQANRYQNQDLIWLLYHEDSDFKIHQLSLVLGMAWNLSH